VIHRIFLALLALCPSVAFACSQDYLEGYSDSDKFLAVAENSEFVFFGEVVRLYRLPNTSKIVDGYNGLVFRVNETLKGKASSFMEVERSSWCGVNSPNMKEYWPSKVGEEFVVAGSKTNDIFYIYAVYPSDKAMTDLYRSTKEANKPIKNGQKSIGLARTSR